MAAEGDGATAGLAGAAGLAGGGAGFGAGGAGFGAGAVGGGTGAGVAFVSDTAGKGVALGAAAGASVTRRPEEPDDDASGLNLIVLGLLAALMTAMRSRLFIPTVLTPLTAITRQPDGMPFL